MECKTLFVSKLRIKRIQKYILYDFNDIHWLKSIDLTYIIKRIFHKLFSVQKLFKKTKTFSNFQIQFKWLGQKPNTRWLRKKGQVFSKTAHRWHLRAEFSKIQISWLLGNMAKECHRRLIIKVNTQTRHHLVNPSCPSPLSSHTAYTKNMCHKLSQL
jgi:hypothetical protein